MDDTQPRYSDPNTFLSVQSAIVIKTEEQRDLLIKHLQENDTLVVSMPMLPFEGLKGKSLETEVPLLLRTVGAEAIDVDVMNEILDDKYPKLAVAVNVDDYVFDLETGDSVLKSETEEK